MESATFTEFDVLLLALSAIGFGMWLLIKGGDATVDAASAIAEKFNIPSLLIGFTIVAFGTSLPELLVSVNANFKGSAGIALGNVIGSNIANILLVIGAAAFVYPVIADRKEIRNDTIAMLVVSGVMTALLVAQQGISSSIGFIMVGALFAYVVFQYMDARKKAVPNLDPHIEHKPLWQSSLILLIGLTGVALGADILVRAAITAAKIMHVPDAVIGLTVIAIGTSLPELSTSVVAALKKQSGIALGNILGSNVFNILLIIGVTSVLKPIPADQITPEMVSVDVWVMLAVALLMGLMLLIRGKIGRVTGFLMLALYIIYIVGTYFVYTGA